MNSFPLPLIMEPLSDGETWRITERFQCLDDVLGLITIEPGLPTDLTSIPWTIRPLVGGPWGWYGEGAVIHDDNYKTQRFTRQQADDCLLRCLKALIDIRPDGMGNIHWWEVRAKRHCQMYEIYWGVRAGGWLAWNQHTRKNKAEVAIQ